ncbi:hypothetical protein EG832_09360, partial [bacterium]|nr:hypothetical protein [bacterium]
MKNNIDGRLLLSVHSKQICSEYELIGHDENALTYALGHSLSHDKKFLSSFLRLCNFKNVTSRNIGHAQIDLQKKESESGIVDLEIFIEGRLHLIIEAKIGAGYPRISQIEPYVKRLDDKCAQARVVVLTKIIDDKIKYELKKAFKERIYFLTWSDVLGLTEELASNDESIFDPNSFSSFLRKVYN